MRKLTPRNATEEEINELYDLLLCYGMDNYEGMSREQVFEGCAIAVFDDYITDCPGYTGKLLVLVNSGDPCYTHTFIWDKAGIKEIQIEPTKIA